MTQPELFEELDAPSQPPRRRADKPVFETRRVSWSATYQQLALAGAGMILAFVGAFALGVERGKHVAQATTAGETVSLPRALPPTAAPVIPSNRVAAILPVPAAAGVSAQPEAAASRQAPVPNAAPSSPSRQYTLQLATYTSRAEAERELVKLKKDGYSAYLNEGNQRVALCAGLFPTREAAMKRLGVFRKKYRDCFVRVR